MSRSPLVATLLEARNLVRAVQHEREAATVGPVVVGGMLAEQLVRELGAEADPGAVVVSDDPVATGAHIAVRIVAGDPTDDDNTFVRVADGAGVPVVVVQLWPQANWRAPYVLSPFVVECKTGEGFPVAKIAKQIATAADNPTSLAGRIPVLRDAVAEGVERGAVTRAGIVGATLGGSSPARPVLALEQVGMVTRLRALESPETRTQDQLPVIAGTAAATIAASYAFRALARAAQRRAPSKLVNTVIAAGATWAMAELIRRLEARKLI